VLFIVIQAHGLPAGIRNLGSAYVVIVTAGEGVEGKTRLVKGTNPHWNQEIDMYAPTVYPSSKPLSHALDLLGFFRPAGSCLFQFIERKGSEGNWKELGPMSWTVVLFKDYRPKVRPRDSQDDVSVDQHNRSSESRSVKCSLTPASNSKSTSMELEVLISAIANDTVTGMQSPTAIAHSTSRSHMYVENPTDLSSVAAAVHKAVGPTVGKKSPEQLSAVLEHREEMGAVADAAMGLVEAFEPLRDKFEQFLDNVKAWCDIVDTITEVRDSYAATIYCIAEIWTDTPVCKGRLDLNQMDSKGPNILFVSFYVLIQEAVSYFRARPAGQYHRAVQGTL
jgi:hypothetical protein